MVSVVSCTTVCTMANPGDGIDRANSFLCIIQSKDLIENYLWLTNL